MLRAICGWQCDTLSCASVGMTRMGPGDGLRSELFLFHTLFAEQCCAQVLLAALLFDDPGAQRPRRIVAHVLAVAAGQIGDPVFLLILMKADDDLRFGLLHGLEPLFHRFEPLLRRFEPLFRRFEP